MIDSARFFELKATIGGDRDDLRPGEYTLKKGMTNGAAITALTTVPETPQAAETVSVTLVEGPSRKENAPVVDDSGKVEGSYARASSSKATLRRIRELGAPKGTKTAEGFLFPATYELNAGASANELVEQQLDAFEENFKEVDMRRAKRANLTRYDVLIIASMIEREAQLARERSLVSAVIYNRLKEGMPLGIDATIRYSTNNWQRPIRQSELDRDEPYNTRLNRGLPPTPIGNPGLASIKAAAKPSSKNYLFYVRKPGKSGEHAFSSHRRAVPARRRQVPGLTRRRMIRLGVCGWPVAHSRSPQMHNAALKALGLHDWRYQHLPIPPHLFKETVRALPKLGFKGVNVTIPHKEQAFELADQTTETANAIKAANTLTFNADGTIHADNTDAPGFLQCLRTSRLRQDGARARRRRLVESDPLRAPAGRRQRAAAVEPQPRARASACHRVPGDRQHRARRHHRQLHGNRPKTRGRPVQGAPHPGR